MDPEAPQPDLEELVGDLAGGQALLGGQLLHAVMHPGGDPEPDMLGSILLLSLAWSGHARALLRTGLVAQ
jgi:hypothetical protein